MAECDDTVRGINVQSDSKIDKNILWSFKILKLFHLHVNLFLTIEF